MADQLLNMSPTSSSLTVRELWRVGVTAISGRSLPLRNVPITNGQGRLVAAIQDVVVCLAASPKEVSIAWEYLTGGFIPGSPAVAPDGSLRVHSCDRRLHGLSASGEPLWPAVEVGDPLSWASPLVDQDGNTWLCSATGGLIKVDAHGRKAARPYLRSPTRFDCAGVLHAGWLIVGGEDQFVHAIDVSRERGAEVWDQQAARGKTNWFINSAIAVAEGPTFVVASRDDHLYGFSAEGEELWKTPTPGRVLGSPVIDGKNRVLVGVTRETSGAATGGALACFDLRSRTWQWEAAARGPVESTPVAGADGTIYFGDNAGQVHAVNEMGRTLASHDVGHPVRSAGVIVGDGQVVFGDDSGSLFGLSCDSSALSSGWPKLLGPALWTPTETSDALSHRAIEGARTKIHVVSDQSALAESGGWALLPDSLPTSTSDVLTTVDEFPSPPHQPAEIPSTTPATVPAVSEQTPDAAPPIKVIAEPKPPFPDVTPISRPAGDDVSVGAVSILARRASEGSETTGGFDPSLARRASVPVMKPILAEVAGPQPRSLPTSATPSTASAVSEQTPSAAPPINVIAEQKPPFPDVAPTVTQPEELPGRLISVIDFLSGTELLRLSPTLWCITRATELKQFPLMLTNDGPGDLEVTVQSFGHGLSVSPSQRLRIPSGRRQFVVLNIAASADEWLLLDFQTSSTAPGRRQRIRIQCH